MKKIEKDNKDHDMKHDEYFVGKRIYSIPERSDKKSHIELLNTGGYDLITDEVKLLLSSENPKNEETVDIILIEFGFADNYEQVIDVVKKSGLEIPQMQDVLRFGIRYRNFEEELANSSGRYSIIFPHYPIYLRKSDDYLSPRVIEISYDNYEKSRNLSTFWFGTQWNERRHFAARKTRIK